MFKVNFKKLISENNNFSYFLIFLLVQSFAFADAYVSCGGTGEYCLDDYCADEIELHEVRCCTDSEQEGYQQMNGCETWAESQFSSIGQGWDGCVNDATFAEAEAVCAGEGARLCTLEELQAGCTAGTGCAHDSDMIWTSDECLVPGHGCMEEDACNYDPNATFDNGSCLYQDCAGECGGNAVEDEGACDCDGNVLDCAGDCGGDAIVDECGECNGDGIAEGACDCDGNILDCAGDCGGDTIVDECGECAGDGSEENFDCDGNCLINTDCAGTCGGDAVEDECGVCNGNSNPQDCNNDGIDDVCEETYDIGFDTGFFEGQSTGDINHDGNLTITDIVIIIDNILND